MKKILTSLALICLSVLTQAQATRQAAPANAGNFFVTKTTSKGQERVLVGCTLTAPPVTTTLKMNLVAWEPMLLSAKIMNDNSELVANWMPSNIDKTYSQQFDVSNLTTGKYHFEIYGPDGKKVHTIDFEKQDAINNNEQSSK